MYTLIINVDFANIFDTPIFNIYNNAMHCAYSAFGMSHVAPHHTVLRPRIVRFMTLQPC